MRPQQLMEDHPSQLRFPSDISNDCKPPDAPPPYPLTPPASPSRKPPGDLKLQNATTEPTVPPNTPTPRKSSSTSTLVALPTPLRIFKRQTRRPSFSALLSRPSIQSLKAQLFPNTVAESATPEAETAQLFSKSFGPRYKTSKGHMSCLNLLHTPPESDDEGYNTDLRSQASIKTPRIRSFSGEEEGYVTDVHLDLNLESPVPVRRELTKPNLAANGSLLPSCALCRVELKNTLDIYAFPTTAPAISGRIRDMYPVIETNICAHGSENCPTHTVNGAACNAANQSLPFPTFCLTCFERFHALHICWTCGFTIHRKEERVGYGWAWWHWGCMSCLLCRAPVSPPTWTAGTITLSDSPACKSCLRELRDLVYIERRRLNASRRGFSPPWRPEVGLGITCNDGAGAAGSPEESHDVKDAHGVIPPISGGFRRISGVMKKLSALDGSASVAQSPRNSRMHWMMRKGEGNVSGGGAVGAGRRASSGHGLGGIVYPPLPKWMEKLPGRRNASGGIRKL